MGREAAATVAANERLTGSTVLLTGASGFLGKVVLTTLLARADRPDRVLVLLRAADAIAAQRRLEDEVFASDAFAALPAEKLKVGLEQGSLSAIAGDLEDGRVDTA